MKEAWKNRLGSLLLGAFSLSLAVGWWLDHQGQFARGEAAIDHQVATVGSDVADRAASVPADRVAPMQLAARPAMPQPKPTYEALRAQNDDLIQFMDEAYVLLYESGIHVQLDIEKTADGHLRLKADTLKLMDQLEATLQTVEPLPAEPQLEE